MKIPTESSKAVMPCLGGWEPITVTHNEEHQHLNASTTSEFLTIPLSSLHTQGVQLVIQDATKHPKLEMFL